MKILLAYSKAHFDPDKSPKAHKYWGSSANILARNLYEMLRDLGQVTYIDCWAKADIDLVKGREFDVFVGIVDKFSEIASHIKADKKVLFAVNSHPDFRNSRLRDFITTEKLAEDSLSSWDIVGTSFTNGVQMADFVIGVGDNLTYNSYTENGVPKKQVKFLNYGVGKKVLKSEAKTNRFAYIASDIGLRKGFDIIYSLFTDPEILSKDFHLDIVGKISTDYHHKKMAALQKKMGKKLTFHDWLSADSKEYKRVLNNAAFLVYPALEEGQAGIILDSLINGIIPITSKNTGVPFSPMGQLETKLKSQKNKKIITNAMQTGTVELARLRNHARQYYLEFHSNFEENLRQTLESIITKNTPFPKISLVLPIFNKESVIEDLLKNLDRSCAAYGNNELHIIFDGCKDKSEKIVRKFFKHDRGYPVTFETTPNIFEVKTNNIGLKKSTGKYAAIIQDDNFVYDRNLFFETAMLLDNNPKIAILGGLAGVNFYPRGTTGLKGSGQIAMNDNEAYWRQDEKTNKDLLNQYFEVDACMRGPLFFRKQFLDDHGYLDEAYAPFYMDDMDICFRAKSFGYRVYTAIFNVENRSLTVAKYSSPERQKFWIDTMKRSADIFYSRWTPSKKKDYEWIHRIHIADSEAERIANDKFMSQFVNVDTPQPVSKRAKAMRKIGSARRKIHGLIK